LGSSF
jgi:hypothetical protein